MSYPFYEGQGSRKEGPVELPKSRRAEMLDPSRYLADPGLVDACNVALLLSQPLLLTGKPGTGKTQFAASLAWELNLDDPLKFETKSTSESQDLFYTYDALKRFQDIQTGTAADSPLPYIRYGPLGEAILRSNQPSLVSGITPREFHHPEPQRSIVLIDEIDKAPRDFPNDILNELERSYFRVRELGNEVIAANPELLPIVILTSNSEKDLPDAFLRRCIFYDIPFPDRDRLVSILENRLGVHAAGSSPFFDAALDLFEELRAPESGLKKPPATAELLGWVTALRGLPDAGENPLADRSRALTTLGSLIKNTNDIALARPIVEDWAVAQQPPQLPQ